MKRSKRFEILDARPVNKDGFVEEWPEVGLVAVAGPNDPKPSVKVVNGVITEMDSKKREDFDMLDQFIADYGVNKANVEKVTATDSVELARKVCDFNVPRAEVVELCSGMTPAKISEVVNEMTVLEMMMGVTKMRARKMPSNQAHVTNVRDNPVMLACDAAEAGFRGFSECETTMGVARYAPFNAISILVGSQCGRPGVLTQCSSEESVELNLGMKGLSSYAETVSVYGTEDVFMDGDDTPWSKAFLASCYASRGMKMRFTSGAGSEVQMGYAEGKSMLYLESRCLWVTKAAGSQGTQNGSVSCIGVPAAVPGGIREVLGENLLAMMLDLECASSNDQTFSHSPQRRVARSLMQMVPGTDYVCSGYSSVPNQDNVFAGSNWDAEDYDDWNIIQHDLKIDCGLRPVNEQDVIAVRSKAAHALQAVFTELDLAPITDEEVEAGTYGHCSDDMPQRNQAEDIKGCQNTLDRGITGIDIVRALAKRGFNDVAESVYNVLKARVAGDYLHTSAIFDTSFHVMSAVNTPNDYAGPKTGYQLSDERWQELSYVRSAISPESVK